MFDLRQEIRHAFDESASTTVCFFSFLLVSGNGESRCTPLICINQHYANAIQRNQCELHGCLQRHK